MVRDAARTARLLTMRIQSHAKHDGLIPRRREYGERRPKGWLRYQVYVAAIQSISISKAPNHCGTQTKMRAGWLFGKYRA